MANEVSIFITGNLVDDPELRFTPSGAAVVKFRVAQTPRLMDRATNEWKDGEGVFLNCQAWRQTAENIAESLTRGSRVIIEGKLRQRTYDTKEGEKRTVFEVEVEEIGASLRHAQVKINKVRSGDSGSSSRPAAKSAPAERSAPKQAATSPADDW